MLDGILHEETHLDLSAEVGEGGTGAMGDVVNVVYGAGGDGIGWEEYIVEVNILDDGLLLGGEVVLRVEVVDGGGEGEAVGFTETLDALANGVLLEDAALDPSVGDVPTDLCHDGAFEDVVVGGEVGVAVEVGFRECPTHELGDVIGAAGVGVFAGAEAETFKVPDNGEEGGVEEFNVGGDKHGANVGTLLEGVGLLSGAATLVHVDDLGERFEVGLAICFVGGDIRLDAGDDLGGKGFIHEGVEG